MDQVPGEPSKLESKLFYLRVIYNDLYFSLNLISEQQPRAYPLKSLEKTMQNVGLAVIGGD